MENKAKNVNVRVGDEVVVIAGDYKGKKGKVISVNPEKNTCVVKDVNIVVKHQKMRKQGEKSERKKMEAGIDISNVQIICSKCNHATRVGNKIENNVKHRVCKKCGNILDKKYVKPKTKAEAEKAADVKEEKVEKKPLQRREVKHVAESTIKKPSAAKVAPSTKLPRKMGGE